MPLSCSRRIAMICSSVNLDRLIVRLLQVTDSTQIWRNFRGSGHPDCDRNDRLCSKLYSVSVGAGGAAYRRRLLHIDKVGGRYSCPARYSSSSVILCHSPTELDNYQLAFCLYGLLLIFVSISG